MTMADARVLGTSLAVLTAAFWTYYLWDMGTAAGAAWGSLLQVVFGTWLGGRDGESATAADVHQMALDRAADRVLASDAGSRDSSRPRSAAWDHPPEPSQAHHGTDCHPPRGTCHHPL
jgi:hypothetical protein